MFLIFSVERPTDCSFWNDASIWKRMGLSSFLPMHGFYKRQRGRVITETGTHYPGRAGVAGAGCMRVTAPEWISQDAICESHSGQAMYLALSLFLSLPHPSNIHPFQEVSREGSSFSLRASLGEGPRDSFKESLATGLAFF